jgi:hypothetical protein
MAILNFDATNVPQAKSFEPLPNGWYNVQVTSSDIVPTKAGTGTILKLTLTVLDGVAANRLVFCNLNIVNPNPQAQAISEGHLSAICHSTGVVNCADSNMLHGIPFQVKLGIQPAKGNYEASNQCKAFKPIGSEATAQGASGAPLTAPVVQQPVAVQQAAPAQPVQPVQPVAQAQPPVQQPPAAAPAVEQPAAAAAPANSAAPWES